MKLKSFIVIGRHIDHYYTTIKKGKSKATLKKRLEKEGWTDFSIEE